MCTCKGTEGSNPSLSAIFSLEAGVPLAKLPVDLGNLGMNHEDEFSVSHLPLSILAETGQENTHWKCPLS
jgi:hypothetical protein